jgi:hypothetical protein
MAKSYVAAAQHLASVLERENAALRAMDLRRAAALLPAKSAAVAHVVAAAAEASETPAQDVISDVRKLAGLALENRRLLERAITAQHRVIGILVRAVAATSAAEPAYGAMGHRIRRTDPLAISTRA